MSDYIKETILPLDTIGDHGFKAVPLGALLLHTVGGDCLYQKLHLSVTNTSMTTINLSLTLERTAANDPFGPLTATIALGTIGGATDYRFELDLVVGENVEITATADAVGAVFSGWVSIL